MVKTSEEVWKSVPGLRGRYEISSEGRCRSVDTHDVWGRIHKGRVIAANIDRWGYPRVRVCVQRKKQSFRVHRLVAEAFVPNPDKLPQVNHRDGDKTNNHYSNLEWVTNSENQLHAIQNGLKKIETGTRAIRFKSPILVFDESGRHVDTLSGNLDMKRKGYDWRNVNACIYGTRKSHRGMTFKRDEEFKP